MPLELNTHICGTVLIVECAGRIASGPETESLLAVLHKDSFRNLKHVVLGMAGVSRIDSSGIGLIVRYANSLRQRGGDLRLAAVTPTILEILRMTRLDSVLKLFASEDEAVLSFLERDASTACVPCAAGCVVLVDQSPDFCAFATAVLTQHAYEVKAASLVRDAKILLMIEKPNFILVGPSTRPDALEQTLATFRSLAPNAKVLAVDPALKTDEPQHAGEILLQMLTAQQV
ncbi:STAS domain-containing protein [Occallatibacter riparius]|uniref:Anti-sigma factor antagonist n=1 Tax=Occallatibacter riparius TaxID=1002689 RepID=A0A9J7BIH5_9BACT|nr:STAS domain-containing protein [Occallatibacter riparius]UWZ82740.1 STAS domain-containing protein [Occallatibacter riparius]